MSKKRASKKNQDFDQELEQEKASNVKGNVTSKKDRGKTSKGKNKKDEDWSDNEEKIEIKKDTNEASLTAPKKSNKKGIYHWEMLLRLDKSIS